MPGQTWGNNDAHLYHIQRLLRIQTGAIINGGGGGGNTSNYQYLGEFTIGETPGAPTDGSTSYTNPFITGQIQVHKNGTGYLENRTDGDQGLSGFIIEPGGELTLTGGLVFSNDEHYTIFRVNP